MNENPGVPMSEFQQALSQYHADDFINDPFEPLQLCYEMLEGNLGEYDRYQEILFHTAQEKGILQQCKGYWEIMSKHLRRVRAVLSLINSAEHDQETTDN